MTTDSAGGGARPPVDPGLSGAVALAVADLAARLAVQESEISVGSAEVVTWPDAALGCRQPGRMYAQVISDGARIILRHDGRDYSYHTGGSTGTPFLCAQPSH